MKASITIMEASINTMEASMNTMKVKVAQVIVMTNAKEAIDINCDNKKVLQLCF